MSTDEHRQTKQPPQPAHHQQARWQGSKRIKSLAEPGKIVSAFNTWAFKREQPSDVALLTSVVATAIAEERAVEFVLYWGKGPRAEIAKPDLDCLDYLQSLTGRIAAAYSYGAVVRIIFTDSHAALNGHSPASMTSYFDAIAAAATSRGFQTCVLSDLVRRLPDAAPGTQPAVRPADTLANLTRSAARWYRGAGRPADGAVAYYDMNMVERRAVEHQFPAAIFITFNGSEVRDLFPEALPVFYMYSLRKGFSVKPWFLDETGAAVVLPESLPLGPSQPSKGASAA